MPLDHFAFVLFSPQSPGNIGAVARALKNMGCRDLRMVRPAALPLLATVNEGALAWVPASTMRKPWRFTVATYWRRPRHMPELSAGVGRSHDRGWDDCASGPYRSRAGHARSGAGTGGFEQSQIIELRSCSVRRIAASRTGNQDMPAADHDSRGARNISRSTWRRR